ncbi:3D-(3,5/4)-trihydroxycyclohexane-1,2-dione acylhydrolase (decyclizing) [Marinococcus halophilus]|uniref:3D-(3,5/4)-trihydroxycyclohexane-1,2-dione acylhydrolase (decyclizing) n=1 Tax=Marinococcus halophilus TaxID=1371 RepID=UPI0009A7D2AB|nr:3D-(3,5/4)-trihydroxycyclohexane-1,2-dione acylhydrolase (decyclizing) [Marinococcus halophilus]
MQTIRLTMAQALIKFLNSQYIKIDGEEHKFVAGMMGIFGHGNVVGLGQALEQYKQSFSFYQGKNEQEIAHAAMAYAKQKRRKNIYAVTASIGPGSANLVTAAGTATVNRLPALFLPSDNFATRQPDPVLQQIEDSSDYTVSVTDSLKPVSKYWDRIVRPEQLITACLQAMRVLTDPAETGAVTLALPQDVQAEAYDYPVSFFEKRVHNIERRPAADETIEEAVRLISTKKKPFIICGGGVRYSEASETLKIFAEKFNIPFGETQTGKGNVAWDHPYNLGGVGICGTLAANRIAKESDLIIAIGTRLNDFVTSSKKAYQNHEVDVLTINVNALDANKLNASSITADAKAALTKLSKALEKINYMSSYTDEIQQANEEWQKEMSYFESIEEQNGLSQTRVLMELNKQLDSDAVIVSASGSLPSDLERLWRPSIPDTYHLEYGFSCMGYEVPGALGAKLAHPEREVYAFVGDGAYLMGHTELYTSIQEGIKFNIILFDNNGFQCIHNLQRAHGIDSFGNEFRHRDRDKKDLSGSYAPIDFAKNAESYGAKAYTVTSLQELNDAIEQSKLETTSTLIHVKVLPGTMTEDYESFWHVGVPEVSESKKVKEAHETMRENLKNIKLL